MGVKRYTVAEGKCVMAPNGQQYSGTVDLDPDLVNIPALVGVGVLVAGSEAEAVDMQQQLETANLDPNAVTPPANQTDEEVKMGKIVDALKSWTPKEEAPDNWTENGLPAVPALVNALGFTVTKEQRDNAWATVQAG